MLISAVLVTRGDVDLSPVLDALPFEDIVIHDNSKMPTDSMVYGRYLAMQRAKYDIVYTIDDDAITNSIAVCSQYREGMITANVPHDRRGFYSDGVTLLGWGSVFDRGLTAVFEKYLERFPADDLFLRECDRIFTGLNQVHVVDVPIKHLPHAHGSDRMGAESRHLADLAEVRRRIYSLR